jgi:hypothetical protein
MSDSLLRIFAITKADFLIRFRRTSTVVLFLLLCIAAYQWVPDVSTGRTLIQMSGRRAIYNSAAVGMASGLLCSFFILLTGYYMISNTIRRDIQTRAGFIIASTTVRNSEYLIGKFVGNIVFLSAIAAGYMISSMVMQLIRREAPLEPLVFIKHYLLLLPPAICFVSVIALLFESIRFLSGRFGDVVYFFLWMATLSIGVVAEEQHANWPAFIDPTGIAMMMQQVKDITHSTEVSIGASQFDPTKPPFIFPGLSASGAWWIRRLSSALFATPLLLVALAFFHRFDPVRLKLSGQKAHQGWFQRINGLLKPITARLLRPRFGLGSGLLNSIFAESSLTLRLYPMAILWLIGSWVVGMLLSPSSLRAFLPMLFASLVVIIADAPTREIRNDSTGLIFSSPLLKQWYVGWKFMSVCVLVILFMLVPMIRHPQTAMPLLIGTVLIASAATSFGILSHNPKTFVVLFLMFLYLVVNDGGKTPYFDFAGFYGTATAATRIFYLGLSASLLAAAQTVHFWRLKRYF